MYSIDENPSSIQYIYQLSDFPKEGILMIQNYGACLQILLGPPPSPLPLYSPLQASFLSPITPPPLVHLSSPILHPTFLPLLLIPVLFSSTSPLVGPTSCPYDVLSPSTFSHFSVYSTKCARTSVIKRLWNSLSLEFEVFLHLLYYYYSWTRSQDGMQCWIKLSTFNILNKVEICQLNWIRSWVPASSKCSVALVPTKIESVIICILWWMIETKSGPNVLFANYPWKRFSHFICWQLTPEGWEHLGYLTWWNGCRTWWTGCWTASDHKNSDIRVYWSVYICQHDGEILFINGQNQGTSGK